MSKFIGRPPPGGSGQAIGALVVCQLLVTLYDHWVGLENRKADRTLRQQELDRERAALRAQLATLRAQLSTQVGVEEARSRSFIAAMQAAAVAEDPEIARQILDLARDTLSKPMVVPRPGEDLGA